MYWKSKLTQIHANTLQSKLPSGGIILINGFPKISATEIILL